MFATHVHTVSRSSESVLQFVQRLFDADFVPRFQCVNERDDLLWLHVVSDAFIALAYYSIPLALMYFARKRRDIEFNWMYVMFAAFIVACGTTHLISVAAFWHPMYRLDGVVKALTAVVSIVTAVLLWPLLPSAIALPSPSQLARANAELAHEVGERRQAQEQLRRAHDELEQRVQDRTANLAAEIEERKKVEEHRSLLMAELDHRVKNNLSTVLSIAEQTLRATSSVSDFRSAFMGRVASLARTHAALAQGRWHGASLEALLRLVLAPHTHADGGNVELHGPRVMLGARVAPPLTMALHELATNAAKYGAFSSPAGRVRIGWEANDHRLVIDWRECDGPPVAPPTRQGLGTTIIDGTIRYELGGQVDFEYPPEGTRVRLSIPLKQPEPSLPAFEPPAPESTT